MREYVRVRTEDLWPTPADLKRRARAAWAYSLIEQKDLVVDGVPYNTLRGLLGRTGPSPSVEQAWAIADACSVPRSFINDGWESGIQDRVAILEAEITQQRAGLAALAADSLRRTREQQGRSSKDRLDQPPAKAE